MRNKKPYNGDADFVYHVALRMPTFIPHISVDFHELLQYSTAASSALGRKTRRIVKMTVYVIFMFVIRILRTKQSRAQ